MRVRAGCGCSPRAAGAGARRCPRVRLCGCCMREETRSRHVPGSSRAAVSRAGAVSERRVTAPRYDKPGECEYRTDASV